MWKLKLAFFNALALTVHLWGACVAAGLDDDKALSKKIGVQSETSKGGMEARHDVDIKGSIPGLRLQNQEEGEEEEEEERAEKSVNAEAGVGRGMDKCARGN